MKVKITRNTGLMGSLSKVNVKIDDGIESVWLGNGETYEVETEKESVTIRASMWTFGSRRLVVTGDKALEIRTNPLALLLYFVPLMLIFVGAVLNVPTVKETFLISGIVLVGVMFIYSAKMWFLFRESGE